MVREPWESIRKPPRVTGCKKCKMTMERLECPIAILKKRNLNAALGLLPEWKPHQGQGNLDTIDPCEK